jgi:endogenous inhibitor of DNA gyrase (YacG/DUF329 family)
MAEERRCTVCGASIEDKRRDAIYCSAACKQVAYRRRKAEQRTEQTEQETEETEQHDAATWWSWLRRLFGR